MYNLTSNNNLMSTIKLANSLIIKSHAMAVHMNIQLGKDFGVTYDSNDMTTWPYYLNLSGLPHGANSDIILTSLDTGEEFTLSKFSRTSHPRTFKELDKKEDFYKELIVQYPMQELYILGMLYPTDINDLISYEDGKIIYYNKDYVEYNEQSLIAMLEVSIQGYMSRWLNEEFILTDDLYIAGFWASLIGYIVKKIYLIRYSNIGSYEINNYYKTAILNSYMGLGVYADVLSNYSQLWLSKNISYINYNIGQDKVLKLIVDKILRESNVYVDEVLLEPIQVSSTNEVSGPSYFSSGDQVYIANFGTNEYVKYDVNELINNFIIKNSVSENIDLVNHAKTETLEAVNGFRDIETKTKFLILTDRYIDIMNISYNIELLFDVIVYELNNDEVVTFIIENERTVLTTKKEILKAFIYLIMSKYTQEFNIVEINTHSLILDTVSDYALNYSPITDYFNKIKSNIDSIFLEQVTFIGQQYEIYKYLLVERSNLSDDFTRYEFDRFVNTLKKDKIIPINLDSGYTNSIIENGTGIDNLFISICAHLGISIPTSERIDKFREILKRLTSYTVNVITNTNVSDAFIPDHTMKLEGPTVMTITGITLDCNGSIAVPTPVADTDTEFIYKGTNNLLTVTDADTVRYFPNAYVDDMMIIKEEVIMDVVDAGV